MAAVNTLVHSFNVGEVSESALARVDNERLRLAAVIQENLYPHVIGKGQVRPGQQYLGATYLNAQGRLIPFIRETDDVALLEFTDSILRVWEDGDTLVTRPSVTSTVTNGDFSSSAGWTLTTTDGAGGSIAGGFLSMAASGRGSSVFCERAVTTTSAGTEHALRIVVTKGPVLFRCGSSSGADDYVSSTTLDTGTHSLAFIPSGTYYPRLSTRSDRVCNVDSITVEAAGVMTLPGPWTTAQLPLIRNAQSADIVFLACASWKQRKIERRGNGASAGRSWSVVEYQPTDGPFLSGPTEANVQITPGACYGSTTLTATSAIFKSTDVGSLIRIFTYGQSGLFGLSGADQYGESVRISGVGADNDFTVVISGVFVGTLTLQRSYDGPDTGFQDTSSTYTAPTTTPFATTAEWDNVINWVRVGFKAGAYTSGTAYVSITYNGGGGQAVFQITAYTSSVLVTAEVTEYPTSIQASSNWAKGAWSDIYGWPSSVTFFDGRLWWGGKDKFWSSQSDSYYKFSLTDNTSDSGSIQRSIATGGQINTISWILPLQRLLFGTTGAEVSARSSSFDEPLTPNNITIKDASTQGVAALSPVKMDGRGVYVHRDGTHLFEIVYDFESNDYRATALTNYNDDIGGDGFTELAIQRSPENYIWALRSDGICPVMLYDTRQKAAGWFKHITAATVGSISYIESVCVLPGEGQDRVYMIVQRLINGSTVRYVERLAKHSEARGAAISHMADSYVYTAGPVASVTAAHLANETGLVAWATSGSTRVALTGLSANGAGTVSLGATYTNITLGLQYFWRYKSAKLAYGAANGTALLMTKKVDRIGLLTQYEHPSAIQYGRDFTNVNNRLRVDRGEDIDEDAVRDSLDTETFPIGDMGGAWDTDSRVCLVGVSPYPATILALVMDIETNEDRQK